MSAGHHKPPGADHGASVILEAFSAAPPALWALAARAVPTFQALGAREPPGLPGRIYTDHADGPRVQVWLDAYGRIHVRALAKPREPLYKLEENPE